MVEEDLSQLISGCIRQERHSQKMLYKSFYGFAMSICLRYTGDRDEAASVLNQGFFKAFTHLQSYDTTKPFKAWLGRIMTNASIDHYRANLKMSHTEDLEMAEHISNGDLADKNLNYEDLLRLVQQLPQAYRTVFNLYAIDGYTHDEIGAMLNINPGTSKSNLHKARQKLKLMLAEAEAAANKSGYQNGLNYSPIVAINKADIQGLLFRKNI